MIKSILMIICSGLLFAACNNTTDASDKKEGHKHKANVNPSSLTTTTNQFISQDSANKMLLSYLNSISYQQNDTDLRSIIFDADSLRAYLANTSISKVKIMFAHTLNYINNGGQNQNAGYQSGALTLIIAGYDTSGNYVYYNYGDSSVKMVLDYGRPCPTSCSTQGTSANDILK